MSQKQEIEKLISNLFNFLIRVGTSIFVSLLSAMVHIGIGPCFGLVLGVSNILRFRFVLFMIDAFARDRISWVERRFSSSLITEKSGWFPYRPMKSWIL